MTEPVLVETQCRCGHPFPLHLRPNQMSPRGRCGVVSKGRRCPCQSPTVADSRKAVSVR